MIHLARYAVHIFCNQSKNLSAVLRSGPRTTPPCWTSPKRSHPALDESSPPVTAPNEVRARLPLRVPQRHQVPQLVVAKSDNWNYHVQPPQANMILWLHNCMILHANTGTKFHKDGSFTAPSSNQEVQMYQCSSTVQCLIEVLSWCLEDFNKRMSLPKYTLVG